MNPRVVLGDLPTNLLSTSGDTPKYGFSRDMENCHITFYNMVDQVKFPMLESSLAMTFSNSSQMSLEEHFNTSQSYQNSSNM
jgi:hypothetical protein